VNTEINRYNRSFVGMMEQCNTGDWVKYEESVEPILQDLRMYMDFYQKDQDEIDRLKQVYNAKSEIIADLTNKNAALSIKLLVASIAAAFSFMLNVAFALTAGTGQGCNTIAKWLGWL
jgi:hypothetical protein